LHSPNIFPTLTHRDSYVRHIKVPAMQTLKPFSAPLTQVGKKDYDTRTRRNHMKPRCGVTGMIRSLARSVISSSLLVLPLVPSLGCDELTVRSFSGATLQFTISVPGATPAGTHLEVWARDSSNSILRLAPFYDQNAYKTTPGLIVRQAISLDSPCM